MKETNSSQIVLSTFQKSCDDNAKLFIPEPRQDEIVDNLVRYYERFYDLDLLLECIQEFIKKNDEPILIYNFALDSGKIRTHLLEAKKSNDEFKRLVKETEERMRFFDEL